MNESGREGELFKSPNDKSRKYIVDIALVILIIAIIIIAVLALLGPPIGNVFSELNNGLAE